MEKDEIVRIFLEKGSQLDKDSLDYFFQNQEAIETFLNKTDLKMPTITKEIIEGIIKKPSVEILKQKQKERTNYKVTDVSDYISKRYEKLHSLIIPKLENQSLVSINKIHPNLQKFSLVVVVNTKNFSEQSIEVDDHTGQTKIFLKENDFGQIVEDEVIGIVCEQNSQRIFGNTIIFPDIPLKKEIAKSKEETYCLFISDFHFGHENFLSHSYEKFLEWFKKQSYEKLYICLLGDTFTDGSDLEKILMHKTKNSVVISLIGDHDVKIVADYVLTNPATIKIENVTCLLFHGDFLKPYKNQFKNLAPEQLVLNFVKKRNINPTFDFNKQIFNEDPYSIDTVPDIIACGHFHKAGQLNYKGTSILTTGSFISDPIFWLVNLKTREIIKLDFT